MTKQPKFLQEKFIILSSLLASCKKQEKRLAYSLQHISTLAPFTATYLTNAPDMDIEAIDAFIFRFSRLQDILEEKLFRRLLESSGEKPGTMIEILNKMEQIGILKNVNDWLEIRAARSYASHEYVDDEWQSAVVNLNNVIIYTTEIFAILGRVEKYIQDILILFQTADSDTSSFSP